MAFSSRRSDPGVVAGLEHGLRRLVIRVQPVAPDEVASLHRHGGEQILVALSGEVLVEVDGEARICRVGDLGAAPAGAVHRFRGLGAPALLEVFGEQGCGTEFALRNGTAIEVHRPDVPWDRPGPATDMAAVTAQALTPRVGCANSIFPQINQIPYTAEFVHPTPARPVASSGRGRSTSRFFGVIHVAGQHSVPPANRDDP